MLYLCVCLLCQVLEMAEQLASFPDDASLQLQCTKKLRYQKKKEGLW